MGVITASQPRERVDGPSGCRRPRAGPGADNHPTAREARGSGRASCAGLRRFALVQQAASNEPTVTGGAASVTVTEPDTAGARRRAAGKRHPSPPKRVSNGAPCRLALRLARVNRLKARVCSASPARASVRALPAAGAPPERGGSHGRAGAVRRPGPPGFKFAPVRVHRRSAGAHGDRAV